MTSATLHPRRLLLAAVCLFLVLLPAARSQDALKLTVLHRYIGSDLQNVSGALTLGRDGNLYGTTSAGGANGGGSVFRITPDGTLTVLHSFDLPNGNRTANYSTLLEDRNTPGVFYGTSSDFGDFEFGIAFQITADGTFTVLHSFNGDDGSLPNTPLAQGRDGNLYGTSFGGPVGSDGVVYKLSPAGAFTLLHSFDLKDGFLPDTALVEGSDGFFYGTTLLDDGSVFRISPTGDFTDLCRLTTGDNSSPNTALVQAGDGSFYGTTGTGIGPGTIYRVTPTGVPTVLHAFTGGLDGASPTGLTLGADGNLYGMTIQGGLYGRNNGPGSNSAGYGTIFQITPAGVFTTLYNFTGGDDGRSPFGVPVPDGQGGFYIELNGGSKQFAGLLYRLTVSHHPTFFTGQESFGNGFYYLRFPIGNYFGYYGFLDDPNYLYHTDLGYEYVLDADDGRNGVYLYDFASNGFFYTNPVFPFPYLYDFNLQAVLYYFPDMNNPGRFASNPRYFYNFATGQIIAK